MKAIELAEIEENAETIVGDIGQEAVSVYAFLASEFSRATIVDNRVFQFTYRSFYRLDNAGLTQQFKAKYFRLLEDGRNSQAPNLELLTRELYAYANLKGQRSLQFSFVTKLANTVNREYPIYDAEVARVFGFRAPYHYKPFDVRLSEYLGFYRSVQEQYAEILRDGSLTRARALFHQMYDSDSHVVPEIKVLDFIFWSAGKLSRDSEDT